MVPKMTLISRKSFLSNLTTEQARIKLDKTKSYVFCVRFNFAMFSDIVCLPIAIYRAGPKFFFTKDVVFKTVAFISDYLQV